MQYVQELKNINLLEEKICKKGEEWLNQLYYLISKKTKDFSCITLATILSAIGGEAMSLPVSLLVFDETQSGKAV